MAGAWLGMAAMPHSFSCCCCRRRSLADWTVRSSRLSMPKLGRGPLSLLPLLPQLPAEPARPAALSRGVGRVPGPALLLAGPEAAAPPPPPLPFLPLPLLLLLPLLVLLLVASSGPLVTCAPLRYLS